MSYQSKWIVRDEENVQSDEPKFLLQAYTGFVFEMSQKEKEQA